MKLIVLFLSLISFIFAFKNPFNICPHQPRSYQSQLFASKLKIALTREEGQNDKLAQLLPDFECVELPCLAFEEMPESCRVASELLNFDVVVITSPQAASLFVKQWQAAGKPNVKVATVGRGTSKLLLKAGLAAAFEPSEALGSALARELPEALGTRALYPCSALAEDTIPSILRSRGYSVERIDTYTTVAAAWSSCQHKQAEDIDIVTFASPSTVSIWAEKLNLTPASGYNVPVVVIGPTSYDAAVAQGFLNVHMPSEGSKGIEAWANKVQEVAEGL